MDPVVACADLVGRTGASMFSVGYLHDDVPVEEAGWYAQAYFKGARITAEDYRTPGAAADALAFRLINGGTCRCGLVGTTLPGPDGQCLWIRVGKQWQPGCPRAIGRDK